MFNGKSILVTGGTGSFGKSFIRRILTNYKPKRLIVYSRDELKQYEMSKIFPEEKFPCIRYFLGDVRDEKRLMLAFKNVDIVIHAAALKHVSAAEYNPFEFVKTNILGAQNIIEAAIERNVERVVALSTDKASNPINLYGATKLCSDKLFVAGNSYSGERGPRFSVVRYGNVLGSRGSVVPFFLGQRKTGTLPITDERMTRFWITLDRGIDLVMQALENARGGEIFVPKIPSMRITELAAAIAPDCKIKTIGIRPGEKLHECMISEDESLYTREYEHNYIIFPSIFSQENLGGKRVAEGFSYTSDRNALWMNKEQLLKILAGYRNKGAELVKIEDDDFDAPAGDGAGSQDLPAEIT